MTKLKTKREIREWLNQPICNEKQISFLWQERVIDPLHPFFVEPQTFEKEQLVTLVRVNDSDYEEDEREKIFLIKPYNMYVRVTREKIKASYQNQYRAEEVEPYEFKETRFKTKVINKQPAVSWIKEKLTNKDTSFFNCFAAGVVKDYVRFQNRYNREEWENYEDYFDFINSITKKLEEEILDYLDITCLSSDGKIIIKIGDLSKFYWLQSENLIEVKPVEQTVVSYVPVVAT